MWAGVGFMVNTMNNMNTDIAWPPRTTQDSTKTALLLTNPFSGSYASSGANVAPNSHVFHFDITNGIKLNGRNMRIAFSDVLFPPVSWKSTH